MTTNFKKVISFIIILALIVPCLCFGTIKVEAATKKDQPMKLGVSQKTYSVTDLKKAAKSFDIGVTKNQGSVTYKSENSQVTVSKSGKVTVKKGTKTGTYKITVTAKGNSKYKSGKKTVTVVVASADCVKALNAYKKYLSQSKIDWNNGEKVEINGNTRCSLIYLDNDDVPELVVDNEVNAAYHLQGYVSIYCYKNGKVQYLECLCDDVVGYYKKKNLLVYAAYGQGGESNIYLYLTDVCLINYLGMDKSDYGDVFYYGFMNGEEVEIGEYEFNSTLNETVGNTKMSKISYWANTESNRNSKLK